MRLRVNHSSKNQSFQVGSAIDVGQKRTGKPNQDSIRITLPDRWNHRPPLLVLSDGMGGYGGGEVASKIAVDTVTNVYLQSDVEEEDYLAVLKRGITEAHQAIKKKAKENKELEWMGCTIVAIILSEDNIYLANVGDSRAYLIKPEEIKQISYDHSFVAEQVRMGLITELEALTHPKRNVLSLSLTGRREKVPPFLATIPWTKDDRLLLCSDGLWGSVTDQQIQTVTIELEIQKAADKLIKLANTNGGPDNISVIIAQHEGTQPVPMKDMDETGDFENISEEKTVESALKSSSDKARGDKSSPLKMKRNQRFIIWLVIVTLLGILFLSFLKNRDGDSFINIFRHETVTLTATQTFTPTVTSSETPTFTPTASMTLTLTSTSTETLTSTPSPSTTPISPVDYGNTDSEIQDKVEHSLFIPYATSEIFKEKVKIPVIYPTYPSDFMQNLVLTLTSSNRFGEYP